MERGERLQDLPLEELQKLDPSLDESVYEVLGAERALQSLATAGSSAPDRVAEQLRLWQERLASEQTAEAES